MLHSGTYYRVEDEFDQDALKRILEMHEDDFAEAYEMVYVPVNQKSPDDFYLFRDNGARVLAVAHLDTVGPHEERTANFVETEDGLVVFSRGLDDRLGAYVILELLPALGIQYDILLTVGEESGCSTAQFFEAEKEYDWIIEFDRGGCDVVMYEYEDHATEALVKQVGARVGVGSFSDICYLEHLGVKAFNWGVGYRDYHGPRAHAFLDDTFYMVDLYIDFHLANEGDTLPHYPNPRRHWWYGRGWSGWDQDNSEGAVAELTRGVEDTDLPERECDALFGTHDHDDEECARLIEVMSIGVGRGEDQEAV